VKTAVVLSAQKTSRVSTSRTHQRRLKSFKVCGLRFGVGSCYRLMSASPVRRIRARAANDRRNVTAWEVERRMEQTPIRSPMAVAYMSQRRARSATMQRTSDPITRTQKIEDVRSLTQAPHDQRRAMRAPSTNSSGRPSHASKKKGMALGMSGSLAAGLAHEAKKGPGSNIDAELCVAGSATGRRARVATCNSKAGSSTTRRQGI
jgi:hypothetical protein